MSEIVTAGILVIGDEILSGRTKDKNIGFIAEYLTNIGIDLKEVRVVADEEADIIAALDALRHRYDYVFTTGGIGPTHDDITADSRRQGVRRRHRPPSGSGGPVQGTLGSAGSERGAAAHGADSRRRRTDPERDHPGARLQDRQCRGDGRRAHDHAGDDGHRGAEAEIGRPDAVGIGPRQCAGRRRRRSLARNRQRPSRHRDRQLPVPGRGQEAEHQSRGPLARSGKARRRDERGQGDAGGIEHHPR